MEDIKILEDYLLGKKMQYGSGYIYFREFVALENLIKGYRELEQEVERQKEINTIINKENLDDKYEEVLENVMTKFLNDNVNNDFIPKSKIREKMEELDNMIKEINKRKTSKVHSRRDYSFKEIFTRTYGG